MTLTERPSLSASTPDKSLVNLSLLLVVWFEVIPMEADIVYELIAQGASPRMYHKSGLSHVDFSSASDLRQTQWHKCIEARTWAS